MLFTPHCCGVLLVLQFFLSGMLHGIFILLSHSHDLLCVAQRRAALMHLIRMFALHTTSSEMTL